MVVAIKLEVITLHGVLKYKNSESRLYIYTAHMDGINGGHKF